MAKLDTLIPFILHCEAGVPLSFLNCAPNVIFAKAKSTGITNDPTDRGGLTVCGITHYTYAAYCNKKKVQYNDQLFKAMSYSEWYEILKTMFWDKWKADEISDQWVANLLVDFVWASGITGIKRVQKILGVVVDGIVGTKTLAAVNASNPQTLFASIHADRLKHFDEICARSASQKKFLKGWRRRVNMITYGDFKYV